MRGAAGNGGPYRDIYTDNPALARFLQREIEHLLYKPFGDTDIALVDAVFGREGDPRSYAAELVQSDKGDLRLVWYDFLDSFNFSIDPGFEGRPVGVHTTFFPARTAELWLDSESATGKPWPEKRGEQASSSACLAWCETWFRPRT